MGISGLPSRTHDGSTTVELGDGELVRRVRRGDERAFEQLYHRYHRRITAYIQGMVHDHSRAEDVAQDVFVSALRRMRETDRPIAFKPWIYEIAKNACIDQFRRSRRAEEVSYDADEGLGAADYGRLVSGESLPETELESKQSIDHLRGAFGGLSETHHEILVMRELEGLSYREIGERLDMTRPSVESTLFRARRRLTEEYEELVSGARCQRIQSIITGAQACAPGARDQRRLARHVSHCQPCRRQARLAGLDVPVTPDRPVRQRIAAVLPLPLFLRRRWSGDGSESAAAAGSAPAAGFAQWSAQFGSAVDPGWFKAAATAATVAVAGAGAGLVGNADGTGGRLGGFDRLVPSLDRGAAETSATARRGGAAPVVAAALLAAPGAPSPGDRNPPVATPSDPPVAGGGSVTARQPLTELQLEQVRTAGPEVVVQEVVHGSAPAPESPSAPGGDGPAGPPPTAPALPAAPDGAVSQPASAPAAPTPSAPPVATSTPETVGGSAGDLAGAGAKLAGG